MDPQDQPDDGRPRPPGPSRASRLARAQARLHEGAARLRTGAGARFAAWDERARTRDFVPASETVVIDVRRHPFLLVPPVLRTLVALVVVAVGPRLVPLLVLAGVTAVWASTRWKPSLKTTGLAALGTAVGVVVVEALAGTALTVLVLLLWSAEDVADWWTDRLVVSNRRIYRRHGVVTRHSPSIALTAVAFVDAAVPPLGRALHYGTLRLDSVAQRDAPLSRFDLVPDVVPVSHEILRLRTAAMPRFPQQPL